MKRNITSQLVEWKENKKRKPLVILGARQVGKTFSVLDFGKNHYQEVVPFNFEGNSQLWQVFERDLDPMRIITELAALSGRAIHPHNTLLFFDEIQASPRAITALKYFCEEAPQYHIVSAGSLLGAAICRDDFSFPVGKVDEMRMHPMDFEEFLWATGNEPLAQHIRHSFDTDTPLSAPLHDKALALYRTYLVVGGMPEAVAEYVDTHDFVRVRAHQHRILSDYSSDMSKYATHSEAVRHEATFNSIPSQLAKENRKFQYRVIGSHARSRDYEDSVLRLAKTQVILKCEKVREGKSPLEFYKDPLSFKVYFSDVGLLSARMMMGPELLMSESHIGAEAKGALAENYVAQQLTPRVRQLYYWESDGRAEVDFVLQGPLTALPIECKAGDNVRSRSLSEFVKRYAPAYSIRISTRHFGREENLKSVPLYAVHCIV